MPYHAITKQISHLSFIVRIAPAFSTHIYRCAELKKKYNFPNGFLFMVDFHDNFFFVCVSHTHDRISACRCPPSLSYSLDWSNAMECHGATTTEYLEYFTFGTCAWWSQHTKDAHHKYYENRRMGGRLTPLHQQICARIDASPQRMCVCGNAICHSDIIFPLAAVLGVLLLRLIRLIEITAARNVVASQRIYSMIACAPSICGSVVESMTVDWMWIFFFLCWLVLRQFV